MSNPAVLSLTLASQNVVTYIGCFVFVVGLIGNPLTLLVFLSLRTFRESSCAFYLTIMPIVNTFHLFTGLLTYIMINGMGINWLNMSVGYCKFRSFWVQICVLMSFSCMCLAAIDQFLATCSNPRWHRFNNIKLARYLLIGAIFILILAGLPYILYYNHVLSALTGKNSCVITNPILQRYFTYFHSPVLGSILPLIIMIVFGVLAYRNVQQLAYRAVPLIRRELDKQLTIMVLVQIFYNVVVVLPLAVLSVFRTIYNVPNDALITAQLNMITTTITIIYYFYFVGSFYIYICVSKRFRQQLIHVLFTVHLDRFRRRAINNNQIEPQA